VMDVGYFLLTQCPSLFYHPNKGDHTGGVSLVEFEIDAVKFTVASSADSHHYMSEVSAHLKVVLHCCYHSLKLGINLQGQPDLV
jgi:hypothetical protein